MSNLKEATRIEQFFDLSNIVQKHQECFEKLYQLSSSLPEEECEPKFNPHLFTKIEDIISPIFLAWQEKYDLIKQLTIEGVAQGGIGRDGDVRLVLNNNEFATLERYDAYDGAIPVKPLKIHSHTTHASSDPELLDCYTHFWRERHNLEVKYLEGKISQTIIFRLEEQAFCKNFQGEVDSVYIEGKKLTRCSRSGCSFFLSVKRHPLDFKPHPYRINDPSFHQSWNY
ncbi:MAG: hypothetical protein Q7R43_04080 [Candidatus Daviesbacteria bacterium]|nr:hypothetical protein [Candidatus Daviesbacteria bacterium]